MVLEPKCYAFRRWLEPPIIFWRSVSQDPYQKYVQDLNWKHRQLCFGSLFWGTSFPKKACGGRFYPLHCSTNLTVEYSNHRRSIHKNAGSGGEAVPSNEHQSCKLASPQLKTRWATKRKVYLPLYRLFNLRRILIYMVYDRIIPIITWVV